VRPEELHLQRELFTGESFDFSLFLTHGNLLRLVVGFR
jgi:hypothetical protein